MRKTIAALVATGAVTAGMIGGAVLTGPVAAVAQETGTETATIPDWVQEVLDDFVADGTLTQTEAEAIAGALAENRPERGHRHGGRHLDTVAEVLGMELEDLRAALADGQTIAEVAGGQTQAVIDALVAEHNVKIDEALADERITQEQADEARANVQERVEALVNGELPEGGPGFGRRGPGGFGRFAPPQDDAADSATSA